MQTGQFRARFTRDRDDIRLAQILRARAFWGRADTSDADRFDDDWTHLLVENADTGCVVGCARLRLCAADQIGDGYAAQFYALDALKGYASPVMELGRFCIAPDASTPDIQRVILGAMTRYVDDHDAKVLFGCSSFAGTDASRYRLAFALLHARHLAPAHWMPRPRAPHRVRLDAMSLGAGDTREALRQIPPMLRSYLGMGGWVSDHAVIDTHMNTLHVFTAVETQNIPTARKRVLRAVGAD